METKTTVGLTEGPSPFVRASCGCIGLHIGSSTEYLCIHRCDRDYNDDAYSLFIRRVDPDKGFKPLSPEDTKVLIGNLAKLVNMGNQLCDLISILKFDYPSLENLPSDGPCRNYREDLAICDSTGESKEQCVCGWKKEDHSQ